MSSPSVLRPIKSDDQQQLLLKNLQLFYKELELFDITLIAGIDKVTAKAHRIVLSASSDYFFAIFRDSLKEEVIEIQNVNGATLNSILNFMYTFSIELSRETVDGVLRAAELLQMKPLIAVCCDFLADQLEPCNCLGVALLAKQCGYVQLLQKSMTFAYANFEKVCTEAEFVRLDENELNEFLSGDDLHVDSQEVLFCSLVAWFQYDVADREKLICSLLLQHIRYTFLTPKFIVENMQKLCTVSDCSKLMCGWLEWHMSGERPRRETQRIAFTYKKVNASKFNVQIYSLESNKWSYEDWPSPSTDKIDYSMFLTNKKFIISGGETGGKSTNRVECMPLQSMEWYELPPMGAERNYHGMAEINGDLYIVGGFNNGRLLNSIEKYDFSTRKWEHLAPMPSAVLSPRLIVLDGLLYVAGEDRYHLDCYNPDTDEWTRTASKNEESSKFGLSVVNGYVYALGGINYKGETSKTVERYNPLNNRWTVMKPLNVGRSLICCTSFNGQLYACGGRDENEVVRNIFEEYNPQTNEWKSLAPFLDTGPMSMFCTHLGIL